MNKNLFKAYLALACVCFFWGTTFLAIRVGVQTIPPLWLVGIRQTLAGGLIVGYFVVRGHPLPTLGQLKSLFLAGVLMIVVGNGFVCWAEVHVPSGLAALLCSLVPFWIIGFNGLTRQTEGLTPRALLGLLVGLSGLVFIFYDTLDELANPAYLGGIVGILIANAGWAGGTVYIKQHPNALPPLLAAGWQILLAGLTVDGLAVVFEQPLRPETVTPAAWWSLIYLILFGSILAYGAYVYALKQLPATVVSLYAYINPVVAVLLGWLWLDERVTSVVWTAMALILTGVWIVNRSLATARRRVLTAG